MNSIRTKLIIQFSFSFKTFIVNYYKKKECLVLKIDWLPQLQHNIFSNFYEDKLISSLSFKILQRLTIIFNLIFLILRSKF